MGLWQEAGGGQRAPTLSLYLGGQPIGLEFLVYEAKCELAQRLMRLLHEPWT